MTESDWLEATDPAPMLGAIRMRTSKLPQAGFIEHKQRTRKYRLVGSACCRRFWEFLDDAHLQRIVEFARTSGSAERVEPLPLSSCRAAVELAEWAADESVSPDELKAASDAAGAFHFPAGDYAACYDPSWVPFEYGIMVTGHVAYAAYNLCLKDVGSGISGVFWETAFAAANLRGKKWGIEKGDARESAFHCDLLRDAFGSLFHSSMDPSWVTTKVQERARLAYDDRELPSGLLKAMRLKELADGLVEAGCNHADLLEHLREPGPHVRGCWALDLLLGRS